MQVGSSLWSSVDLPRLHGEENKRCYTLTLDATHGSSWLTLSLAPICEICRDAAKLGVWDGLREEANMVMMVFHLGRCKRFETKLIWSISKQIHQLLDEPSLSSMIIVLVKANHIRTLVHPL